MTQSEQISEAKQFSGYWQDKGDEKQETQRFWINLLRNVLGVENAETFIEFEKRVKLTHTSFIDAYIPATKVLIEQKGAKIDLHKGYEQSDGSILTPYQQAKRYADEMPNSIRPDWIVVCNFTEFLIYNMETPHAEPVQILLKDLEKEYYRLSFIADTGSIHLKQEMEVSVEAGRIVGKIYDALLKQYKNPESPHTLKSLNMLCVRLVFCLYAEDAGIFNSKSQFHDYMESFRTENMRQALLQLFKVLDTKTEDRDEELEEKLAAFPYVNGGLFTEEDASIPQFSEELREMLLHKASEDFDWSRISPTIFGAVFESTLNPETRRSGGMHYTSIENIHRVIDPLFMDELTQEFNEIRAVKSAKNRNEKLAAFQKKLGSLSFLDPACGSGNFLTETYLSLRRLENECIKLRLGGQQNALDVFGDEFAIQVQIHQFYGIEINDFAVVVAKTALWIAESQMMTETAMILSRNLEFLPLKGYSNIVEGNALRMDWRTLSSAPQIEAVYAEKLHVYKIDENFDKIEVREPEIEFGKKYKELNVITREMESEELPKDSISAPVEYDYIIGNPPFVGARWMDKRQKEDVLLTFGKDWQGVGDLDYVCSWYKKASDMIRNLKTKCAFVSTNSICQGGVVSNLWKPFFEGGLHIDFAWQTFKWHNETADKGNMAAVHCVIVGFSTAENSKPKIIFSGQQKIEAKNINGYLIDAPNTFIDKRMHPISDVPQICLGGQPIDDGNLTLTEEEKDELLKKEPQAEKFIRHYMMGKDFIDRKPRYCLWLMGANPAELRKCREVMRRIEKVKEFRLASNRSSTLRAAQTPALFGAPFEAQSDYVAIPKVSSENRRYVPMDYLSKEIIPGDKLFVMQDASLFHFGVMMSNVHMAWMRSVCGRLKSDYSYSNTIVYNNFPWCNPTDVQKAKIESTAQGILDVRAKYPDSSLADLYDELTMPPELRRAHQENDKAVMKAYGFALSMTASDCVAELFKMYEKLAKKEVKHGE